ncbi:MAG: desulfoferrodoxin [Candidatus Cloacimonetes bacterium HGW-Cloacimonetes-1]|jgi:superoxide reductase|nr:MAG: desulfoferrodoxin [Candidatus Cloacimonetes bacterium HGW-Cloacimonetes-1]
MINLRQIYHCPICGNVVEVLFAGADALVCCGQPMNLLTENSVDAAKEKHVPVIQEIANGIKVVVGAVPHPMEEKHYITMIEVLTAKMVLRHEFKPGDTPEAVFPVKLSDVLYVREYCTLHGLWKNA